MRTPQFRRTGPLAPPFSTPEETQYAVDTLVTDYKDNALQKAKNYQETMDMSASNIYDQLISEYGEQFTSEEAQYAIDNLDK